MALIVADQLCVERRTVWKTAKQPLWNLNHAPGQFSYFADKIKRHMKTLGKICKTALKQHWTEVSFFPTIVIVHFCFTLTSEPGGVLQIGSNWNILPNQISLRLAVEKISRWCKYEHEHCQWQLYVSHFFLSSTMSATLSATLSTSMSATMCTPMSAAISATMSATAMLSQRFTRSQGHWRRTDWPGS